VVEPKVSKQEQELGLTEVHASDAQRKTRNILILFLFEPGEQVFCVTCSFLCFLFT
jgi:hypothetical protein